jgi:sugar fermentation stimulation protein A
VVALKLPEPLLSGRLIRRYKRFLADVRLDDGRELTAHCPNTGAMLGCMTPGSRVWLSESDNPRRRYPHTWELVESSPGVLVGINTARTNGLVEEALGRGLLDDVMGVRGWRREVVVHDLGCRLDFLVESADSGPDCYLEVKNVTAAVDGGVAIFPDAVSDRAVRHVESLVRLVERGHRAALCYCVQRGDVHTVRAAVEIHPDYARALAAAADRGVEVMGIRCRVLPGKIVPGQRVRIQADMV